MADTKRRDLQGRRSGGGRKARFVVLWGVVFIAGLAARAADLEPAWADEFDGPEIDASNWSHQVFGGKDSGNNELQHYTNRPRNSFIENGRLVIQALEEEYDGYRYTSARLHTGGKREFKYGRMEARIKIPSGKGMWPAFWMMPTDSPYGGWPACGEIDILESVNTADRVFGSIHFGGNWREHGHGQGKYPEAKGAPTIDFSKDFHVYAVEWLPEEFRWYVDGTMFHRQTWWYSKDLPFPAPFDHPFHFILNLAVGGTWPGAPDASTVFPKRMEVDWVRAYEGWNAAPRATIVEPAPGAKIAAGEDIRIVAEASDADGAIREVLFFNRNELLGKATAAPYAFTWKDVGDGCYMLRVRAVDSAGCWTEATVEAVVGKGCPLAPFRDAPSPIPGTVEAEDFDKGVPDKAYHDTNRGNEGKAYRPESDVDIQAFGDGEYAVGWFEAGEWMAYTVDVAEDGVYTLEVRAAGRAPGALHLEVDGENVSGRCNVPRTGGWETYETARTEGVSLKAGRHVLRVVNETGGFNLDRLVFSKAEPRN